MRGFHSIGVGRTLGELRGKTLSVRIHLQTYSVFLTVPSFGNKRDKGVRDLIRGRVRRSPRRKGGHEKRPSQDLYQGRVVRRLFPEDKNPEGITDGQTRDSRVDLG